MNTLICLSYIADVAKYCKCKAINKYKKTLCENLIKKCTLL